MRLLLLIFTTLSLIIIAATSTFAAIANHRVTAIPGLPPLRSNTWAGYIPVTDSEGRTRKYFYYYAEAIDVDPKTAPLVFVGSNGPGCSATASYFTEAGPYVVRQAGTWIKNEYSPNKIANFLWLDQPASVGWSIDFKFNGTIWNDTFSATQNHQFIQEFFKSYPELKQNDFWIAGISYFGHFGPPLAVLLAKDTDISPRFKGFMCGSCCIGTDATSGPLEDLDYCFTAPPTSVFDPTLPEFHKYGGFLPFDSRVNVSNTSDVLSVGNPPWSGSVLGYSNLNSNGLRPGCPFYQPGVGKKGRGRLRGSVEQQQQQQEKGGSSTSKLFSASSYSPDPQVWTTASLGGSGPFDPCASDIVVEPFLNQPNVRAALHAEGTYADCRGPSTGFTYPVPPETRGMKSYLRWLFENSTAKIFYFGGTMDADVNHIQSQKVLASLQRPVVSDWSLWYYQDPVTMGKAQQIGGGFVDYDRFSFATVRGAGHMAQEFTPEAMFQLYKSILTTGKIGARPSTDARPASQNQGAATLANLCVSSGFSGSNNTNNNSPSFHAPSFAAGIGAGVGVALVVAIVIWFMQKPSLSGRSATDYLPVEEHSTRESANP